MKSHNLLETIDPGWAWEPWQPTGTESWDAPRVAHLFRRAAFGASDRELQESTHSSLSGTLDRLLTPAEGAAKFLVSAEPLAAGALAANQPRGLAPWWLHLMLTSPAPVLEKMTLFWHGHFATGAEKVKSAQLLFDQNRLLRAHALGSVQQLVQGIARDPAMLVYLDSAVNRKAHPNENFARELMELFCLGEGNYSEKDVQELARCFTGWEVKRNQFRFNRYQHDDGLKRLLGAGDIESGQQAVDVVLRSPHAAQFIVGKLFRFFIADEPTPPARLLDPLAEQLLADNWQIAGVVRRLLGSRLMFSTAASARKVRSPIDWALNWMKACEMTTNLKKLGEELSELGQALFYPPNVKGWDGGRAWINSSTLVGRTNLVSRLLRDDSTRFAGGDWQSFFRQRQVVSIEDLIDWTELHLLARPLSTETRERLRSAMQGAGGVERLVDCLVLVSSLPEMQLA